MEGSAGVAIGDGVTVRRPLLLLLALLTLIGGGSYAVDYYRHRFVRSNGDLVKLLPPGDVTVFFADLGAMRKAGLLRLLANVKPAPDKEYGQFIQETQFDFARDMDALAGAYDGEHLYFVGRGRFNWGKLEAYARAHGGTCGDDFCQAPGSTPGKWANFLRVQADVVALAVSGDRAAADALRPPGRRVQSEVPSGPFWVRLSRAQRANPAALPLPVQIFAISMESADEVVLSVQPARDGAFEIKLNAEFANAAAADTARAQLEIQTKRLKTVLAQEGQKTDPANWTGMLTGGWFRAVGARLTGGWPVRRELLAVLE